MAEKKKEDYKNILKRAGLTYADKEALNKLIDAYFKLTEKTK